MAKRYKSYSGLQSALTRFKMVDYKVERDGGVFYYFRSKCNELHKAYIINHYLQGRVKKYAFAEKMNIYGWTTTALYVQL